MRDDLSHNEDTKKRLLITIGCSWTHGFGCYVIPLRYDTKQRVDKSILDNRADSMTEENLKNYMLKGWPNRVGKKLGVDKVVNLGHTGSSNSGHVKKLYEYIEDNDLSEFDVHIIWMMTEPSRFSFYKKKMIKDYQYYPDGPKLADEYIREIEDINMDTVLEQKFYIRSLESLCEVNKYKLIITSWHDTYPILYQIHKSKSHLFRQPITVKPPRIADDEHYLIYYSFCNHPNEEGYEWISNKIMEGIVTNHSDWISSNGVKRDEVKIQ